MINMWLVFDYIRIYHIPVVADFWFLDWFIHYYFIVKDSVVLISSMLKTRLR